MNKGSQKLAQLCAAHWGAQRELAVKTGLSQSWLSRIVAGTAKPNREQSLMIEKETGIPPSAYDEPLELEQAEPEAGT